MISLLYLHHLCDIWVVRQFWKNRSFGTWTFDKSKMWIAQSLFEAKVTNFQMLSISYTSHVSHIMLSISYTSHVSHIMLSTSYTHKKANQLIHDEIKKDFLCVYTYCQRLLVLLSSQVSGCCERIIIPLLSNEI